MPYTPQRSDEDHTAVVIPYSWIEDVGVEEQHEAETRVLDADLNGQTTTIAYRQTARARSNVARTECKDVVNNDNEECQDNADSHRQTTL